jgi:hypothetical protein
MICPGSGLSVLDRDSRKVGKHMHIALLVKSSKKWVLPIISPTASAADKVDLKSFPLAALWIPTKAATYCNLIAATIPT